MGAFGSLIAGAGAQAGEYGQQIRGILEKRRGELADLMVKMAGAEPNAKLQTEYFKHAFSLNKGDDVAKITPAIISTVQKSNDAVRAMNELMKSLAPAPPTPTPPAGPAAPGATPGSQPSAAQPSMSPVQPGSPAIPSVGQRSPLAALVGAQEWSAPYLTQFISSIAQEQAEERAQERRLELERLKPIEVSPGATLLRPGEPNFTAPKPPAMHVVGGNLVDDAGKVVYSAPVQGSWEQKQSADEKGHMWQWFVNPATHESTPRVDLGPIAKGGPEESGISLTPEAIDFWGQAAASGIPLPSMGFGASGAKARQAIINRAPQVAGGVSLPEAAGTRQANVASLTHATRMRDAVIAFENTAKANLDLFLTRAKRVVDTGAPWINTPVRSINRNALGGADVAAFDAARQVALTEIAKVVNNPSLSSVLSDTARKEVLSLVPENATLKQIYEVANVVKTDMANRKKYLDQQVKEIQDRLGGRAPAPASEEILPIGVPRPGDSFAGGTVQSVKRVK